MTALIGQNITVLFSVLLCILNDFLEQMIFIYCSYRYIFNKNWNEIQFLRNKLQLNKYLNYKMLKYNKSKRIWGLFTNKVKTPFNPRLWTHWHTWHIQYMYGMWHLSTLGERPWSVDDSGHWKFIYSFIHSDHKLSLWVVSHVKGSAQSWLVQKVWLSSFQNCPELWLEVSITIL